MWEEEVTEGKHKESFGETQWFWVLTVVVLMQIYTVLKLWNTRRKTIKLFIRSNKLLHGNAKNTVNTHKHVLV